MRKDKYISILGGQESGVGAALLAKKKGKDPVAFKKNIQSMMWKHAGVFRDAKRLKAGLAKVSHAQKDLEKVRAGKQIREYLDARAMLVACEAILRSALLRTESRAAHYRTDHPKRDDKKWKVNIVCKNVKGKLKLVKAAVKPVPKQLKPVLQKKFKIKYHLLE